MAAEPPGSMQRSPENSDDRAQLINRIELQDKATLRTGARKTGTYQRENAYRRQSIGEKIEEALAAKEESTVRLGVDGNIVLQALSQTQRPESRPMGTPTNWL
ncbi:MAG: hypothetical protein M3Z20_13575 [Chloroflexota bacterium]|nr:hypothetical protein [Chloroflexota bacterium]